MARLTLAVAPLLAIIPLATAQSPVWGQCGGIGWTGPTTCVAGSTCTVSNPYYSQCLPNGTGTTTTSGTGTGGALPTGTSTAGLSVVALAAGKKYFGSATDNPELTDTAYVAELSNTKDFNQITPGNSMKWDATEPSRGTFTFSGGDAVVALAKKNGQLVRGHNCVWHNQLPSWVTSGNFDNATLTSIVQTHCSTVVGHYKGQICKYSPPHSWDVINEPFNDDGTWRSDVFYNTMGSSYVAVALRAARAADPAAKLYINDYNIEGTGAKSTAMVNLVKSLKASGVPIDGIGVQAHLIVGQVPSTLQANLEQFTALGVEVAITELDIRMTLPETAALRQQQKQDYQSVIAACKAVAGCVGVTIWDYTDKYSWVPGTFSGQGAACPWDANLVKKPAYDGIVAGWQS
ncbi:putative candidate xylanase, Glycoside hydrolase family 10 [Lyophyllum shimeji]|uniref:Beta-xylanase n=1 Tax=Lyophyllum shimeji TaxID=47721 RepID=A0A9P3PR76_LYOSH|nr:putative candidate xylanase, Glycoside hydrolase family 10 [Lyophyllum shimeji]